MPIIRSLLFVVAVFISAGFWKWGAALMPAGGGSAFAALVCSEEVSDRALRERLEGQGFTGLVSESGQWVLLDSFGNIEQIPLDEFHERILPFDPRNDGYAQKARSLFVHEDNRFVYIPIDSPTASKLTEIEQKLAAALEDIPFSFHAAAVGRPVRLFLILFCIAVAALLAIPPLRAVLQPHAAFLFPLLPALAPFALGGAAGFALASLLAGCAVLLVGPCMEWFTLPRRQRSMACWLLLPVMALLSGGIVFFSGLPPVYMLLSLAFFCCILAFSLWDARKAVVGRGFMFQRRNPDHQRFTPLPILRRRLYAYAFAWAMLPFSIVTVALVCMGFAKPETKPQVSMLPPADSVTEADYSAHCRYQTTFSLRSLYETRSLFDNNHLRMHPVEEVVYELAPDGLLNQLNGEAAVNGPLDTGLPAGVPPFPFGDLVHYLGTSGYNTVITSYTLVSALTPLLFIPFLFYRKKPGKTDFPRLRYIKT